MAQLLEEKHQLEKKLWEYNTNFTNLKNTTLLGKERAERELEEAELEISSLKKENKTQSQLIEELHDQIVQLKNNMKSQEENLAVCLKGQQEKLEKTLVELQECKTTAQEMRTRKMEELEEVEARVRQAITTKDNVIFGLQEQLLAAHKEIERTEFLLHQEQDAILA
jgi:chromosome segregation ATPase